ncbi:unnamed protein product [Gordionus sp. m RMFG-2023]
MDIIRIIDTGKQELALQNRSRLTPIIDAILVCGIQGIALRGHRDSGAIFDNDNNNNDGNLRAILRNRSLGDPILRDNLLNCSKNATYLSLIIQNEIIDACNKLILITTCTNERTFSNLRRLKTYLQSNTSESRLNGLALLNIHRDLVPTTNEILDTLATFPRKLKITL